MVKQFGIVLCCVMLLFLGQDCMSKKAETMSTRKSQYKVDDTILNRWSPRAMSGESMSDEEVMAVFAKYGPDINEDALTAEYLQEKLSKRRISIKQAIMMNPIMAGLGNIYACDALNIAQISPFRPAQSLNFKELQKLLAASKQVIKEALEYGGTTYDGKYVHVDGLSGSYQDIMRVYGKKGFNILQYPSFLKDFHCFH